MQRAAHPTSRTEISRRRKTALLVSKAERHLSRHEFDEAATLVQTVLAETHDHLGALEVQARLLWKQEDFKALVQTTTKLIALNPFEPGYYGLRGMALRALGLYGEAAKSLSRDPNATQQLADLEAFQASLIKETIKEDPVFAAQYAKDPVKAVTDKGFYFKEREAALAWVSQQTQTKRKTVVQRKVQD